MNGRPAASGDGSLLKVRNARLHNLQGVDVDVPLARLTCVTGVSGSGKSTLVRDVLYANLHHLLAGTRRRRSVSSGKGAPKGPLLGCDAIEGWEAIQRVLEVDQTPIGKTPRSCPATYVGIWDDIRRLFASSNEARMRGYTASRFSFNVTGGRCPECEGQGVKKIEMSFLPDVTVSCDACRGARFNPETLAVTFRQKSIAQVLANERGRGRSVFRVSPRDPPRTAASPAGRAGLPLPRPAEPFPERGRSAAHQARHGARQGAGPGNGGRARTGQPEVPDPPGASRRGTTPLRTLYLLDEPTIGLHMADVEKLVRVLHRLVEAGNTVVIIEHNLDVIAEADWVLDLGPEGGDGGGKIVAAGTPAQPCAEPGRLSHGAVPGEIPGNKEPKIWG